jgi:hypothetical protein
MQRVRVLACLVLAGSALFTVFAGNAAEGLRGGVGMRGGIIEAVPQRVVLPAPDLPTVEEKAEAVRTQPVTVAPVHAEMAGTEAKVEGCGDGSGAETKLDMMENSAIWGHCGSQ